MKNRREFLSMFGVSAAGTTFAGTLQASKKIINEGGEEAKAEIENGISALNAAAEGLGNASYLDTGWERDRVDILRSMESSPFFQKIRGGLITGLYNQQEVWPIFGYEGESFSKGGYINRGFNDIKWV